MKDKDLPFTPDKKKNKQQNNKESNIIIDNNFNFNNVGYFVKTKKKITKLETRVKTYTKTIISNNIKLDNMDYFDVDKIISYLIGLGFKSNLHGDKLQSRFYSDIETKYIYYKEVGFSINLFRNMAQINKCPFKTTEEAINLINKLKYLCDAFIIFKIKNDKIYILGKSGKYYQKLPKFKFNYNYEDKVFDTIDSVIEYHNKLYLEGIDCSIIRLLDFWNNNLRTINL